MPDRFDFGRVNLDAGDSSTNARTSSETPFRVAIFGDFSGRANRGLADIKTVGDRRAILIDRDNFDDVLAGLKVELHLGTREGDPIILRFPDIDDFHPDRLFEHAAFRKLRELRSRVQNPSTFSEVAEEMGLSPQQTQRSGAQESSESVVAAPTPAQLATGSLLDAMIEQTESRGGVQRKSQGSDQVHELARELAAKYSVASPDPRQPQFIAAVDRAVADVMRAILHNPEFQALEAIWRSVFLLVRRLDTSPRLKLFLFDISKAELARDLTSSSDLESTGVFRLLVEKGILTPGADPWALVVGNYYFGDDEGDVDLLARMAKVAKRAAAPFLAGAQARLLGVESLVSNPHSRDWDQPGISGWSELRSLPEADFIGLALPRFLLRLPYGEHTSPLETFEFEEFSGLPDHEGYLWGNPAFAVALLMAQSFGEAGRVVGSVAQLDGLPLHIYKADGEAVSQPCAEVLLTEDEVECILESGIIPLVSYKGRDSVRIARFQSIACPLRELAVPRSAGC
jgi:type VI secretion system protein ImpC